MKKIIILVLSLASLNCYSINKLTGDKWDNHLWLDWNNYELDNSYIVRKKIDLSLKNFNYTVIDNLIENAIKNIDTEDKIFITSEYCNKITSN
jgi:signal transduction histidine kinase